MTISELLELGEPVSEKSDGCDSIVISGTGTCAVRSDWSGKDDACWVVCCAGMGVNTERAREKAKAVVESHMAWAKFNR